MSKKYELVNPFILGSFDRTFTAENSLQAAHMAYQQLSQYFVGHIPKFKFTLQRVKTGYQVGGGLDGDYLHFQVFEKKSEKNSNSIEYAIKPLKSEIMLENFQQKLQNFLKRKNNGNSNILTSESESEDSEKNLGNELNKQTGGNSLNTNDNQDGGKKYVEDEELDPELEKLLYDDETKPKKKKGKKLYALTGPLKGTMLDTPISYYRYDPMLYTEYISYVPVFTEVGKPKRMVYDIFIYKGLK